MNIMRPKGEIEQIRDAKGLQVWIYPFIPD